MPPARGEAALTSPPVYFPIRYHAGPALYRPLVIFCLRDIAEALWLHRKTLHTRVQNSRNTDEGGAARDAA